MNEPFGYFGTYFKGVSSFAFENSRGKDQLEIIKRVKNSKNILSSVKANHIFDLKTVNQSFIFFLCQSERKVMQLNLLNSKITELCSIETLASPKLCQYPGLLMLNQSKDLLFAKKCKNKISIFCLENYSDRQELVLKVTSRKEAMIKSGLDSSKVREAEISSIIPISFSKSRGGHLTEKVIVVMSDGFLNVFDLVGGSQSLEDSGIFDNGGKEGEGKQRTGHKLLDLLGSSRSESKEEEVLKAQLSQCQSFFILSSFYREAKGDANSKGPYIYDFTNNSLQKKASCYIWVLRIYKVKNGGEFKYLTKTTIRVGQGKFLYSIVRPF